MGLRFSFKICVLCFDLFVTLIICDFDYLNLLLVASAAACDFCAAAKSFSNHPKITLAGFHDASPFSKRVFYFLKSSKN